jgi:signal transduction histidine kinase
LRAAGQAKSEFLSRVSHELRTPLNPVLGFGQLLAISDLTAEQQEWVSIIVKAGRHLLGLMDDILDISRIEAGHLEMSIEPLAVGPVIADAVNLVAPLAAQHAVTLHAGGPAMDGDGEGLQVLADHQRLRQVLINLISNGVKYNHPSGTVDVTVRTTMNGNGNGSGSR